MRPSMASYRLLPGATEDAVAMGRLGSYAEGCRAHTFTAASIGCLWIGSMWVGRLT